MKRTLILLVILAVLGTIAILVWNESGLTQELPTIQATLPVIQPIIGTVEAVVKGTATTVPVQSLVLPTPDSQAETGRVCFTSLTRGVTCLDGSGWQVFTQGNGALAGDQVRDAATCPAGEFLLVTSLGISFFDGDARIIMRPEGYANFNAVACEGSKSWWIAHAEGVTHYDGKEWTQYPSSLFLSEGMEDVIIDIAAVPDGDIWLALSDKIVRKHGAEWQVFVSGDGLDGSYVFEAIKVDPSGSVWALHHDGVLRYVEGKWRSLTDSGFPYPRELAFTNDGRAWVATDQGLWVYVDGDWQSYTNANSRLRWNDLYSVNLDSSGRLWLGTDWGVDVIDQTGIQTFYMFDSPLQDDQVQEILVSGAGPVTLPIADVEPLASLSGRFLQANSEPLSNARLQICLGTARLRYVDTPCEDNLFIREMSTMSDGSFQFMDLPEGLYLMAVETSPNHWALLRNELGAPDRVYVQSGMQNDISDLLLP